MKLAHGHNIAHPVHEGITFMAKRLEEISEGKLTIAIYPGQQLGTEREVIELLQIGSVEMTKVSSATIENFVPAFKIFGIPYLFTSQEHQFQVLDGEIGQNMLLQAEKFRIRGLCYYDAGSRSFYTKDRPIKKPQDLAGLKLRVMESITSMNMVKALGGSPTPIAYGELYTALQQGVVDGAENNAPSLYSSRHYEVCKFYSLDEHTALPDIILISTVTWNDLNEEEKGWLSQAIAESIPYQREVWAKSVEESLKIMQEAGLELIYPDKAEFYEKVKFLHDSYKDIPELHKIIQEVKMIDPENIPGV
ncbi:MAG: TRAP transporter substrate-binding protein [Bacteroidota bacterium]|jgi:tripartite ATP-independent transporter DctP family solute receptor|nr:TRAP transporter substrate-binding protein [Bacteroidota bacterium]